MNLLYFDMILVSHLIVIVRILSILNLIFISNFYITRFVLYRHCKLGFARKIQNENRHSQLKQLEGNYANDICWPIKKRITQALI